MVQCWIVYTFVAHQAFDALVETAAGSVLRVENNEMLEAVLRYHIIERLAVRAADLDHTELLRSLEGSDVTVTQNEQATFINQVDPLARLWHTHTCVVVHT